MPGLISQPTALDVGLTPSWMTRGVHAQASGGAQHEAVGDGTEGSSDGLGSSDDDLNCIIEGEIIPRLLLAHVGVGSEAEVDIPILPDGQSQYADELAAIVIDNEVDIAADYVQKLLDRGANIDGIFLEVMAQAARSLGRSWETDDIDFVDVTVGLSRLQQLLHQFTPAVPPDLAKCRPGHKALFLPTPGETHTFGLLMVEDAFRRAGWEVWGGLAIPFKDMHEIIAKHEFQVVGFSLSADVLLEQLIASVADIRASSVTQNVSIIVGGRIFNEQPGLFRRVGADAMARDSREAVLVGELLVDSIEGDTA